MPSFVFSFLAPDSSRMSICLGFSVGSILNTPVATVLSRTLIIHLLPSYTSFVADASFRGVFSSTSVLPSFTNKTVTHVPLSLSRSPLEGVSLVGPRAAIAAPVANKRNHATLMRHPFSETALSPAGSRGNDLDNGNNLIRVGGRQQLRVRLSHSQ